MHKIVILDGYTMNPGDLSWERFQSIGTCEIYERTSGELAAARCRDADIVLTSKVVFDAELLDQLPKLRYIGVLATGYNVIDVEEAKKRGITVTNIPAYSTMSVAQMAFSLLLELCSHTKEHSDSVKEGEWSRCRDFCYWNHPVIELADKTLGIVGFGRIGQQTARIGAALGMRILAFGRTRREIDTGYEYRWTDTLNELLEQSDVVSLHCPLFPETERLINRETIKKMKKTAFLINTSRGPLIDEEALAEALISGEIAGAGLDVLAQEPPRADHPLMKLDNCIITPHIAWASREARSRLIDITYTNLKGWLEGSPVNVVS